MKLSRALPETPQGILPKFSFNWLEKINLTGYANELINARLLLMGQRNRIAAYPQDFCKKGLDGLSDSD